MTNFKTKIMFLLLCSVLIVNASSSPSFGVKSGDWMTYDFQETLGTGEQQLQTIEFLNVVGTNATICVTIHWSTGLETNQTRTIDLSSEDNSLDTIFLDVRVYIVPCNLGVGDSVYLGKLGNQTIAGEASRNVAGASRRLVYANFSQSGSLYTFYWDMQTGVLVEGIMSVGSVAKVVLATETNMWGGDFVWWPWIAIIIIITIIACSIIVSRKNLAKAMSRNHCPIKLLIAFNSIRL
jgi:hypothetical protein